MNKTGKKKSWWDMVKKDIISCFERNDWVFNFVLMLVQTTLKLMPFYFQIFLRARGIYKLGIILLR